MKHHVLCIDDETHNLEALERLLRKNYQVTTSSSGELALKQMDDHAFSVIISDQKMPEMTGVEFFVKARKKQPDAIRILLTGYTDLESVIGAINEGQIYRYVTKPWEPEELLTTLKQALEYFDLKQLVQRQNEELVSANKALKSLDKLKTDFMLLVNHELKTPLTGIFSYVQLLKEESLNEDQQLYVQKITTNTLRLQDLINDTLLITRLKSLSNQETSEEFMIAPMLDSIWKDVQTNNKKNLKLVTIGQIEVPIRAQKKYLEILLKKLVHNCFDHAKNESDIEINIKDTPNSWSLKFKNQSHKELPQESADLIMAFKKTGDILNHTGGAGLGLAVVQSITQHLGGQMDVDCDKYHFEIQVSFPKK